MRRSTVIEPESGVPRHIMSGDHAVLVGTEAVAALIAGWRAGWRRRLEWCPQEICVRDSAHAKSYQRRLSYYARQASASGRDRQSISNRWRGAAREQAA